MPFRDGSSYGTWVAEDELERPQRDALLRALEAMTPPGLVQQGTMLREHLSGLGPVQAAARTADDLRGLFDRLGPLGPGDVVNPVQLGAKAGAALASGVVGDDADAAAPARAGRDVPPAADAFDDLGDLTRRVPRAGREALDRGADAIGSGFRQADAAQRAGREGMVTATPLEAVGQTAEYLTRPVRETVGPVAGAMGAAFGRGRETARGALGEGPVGQAAGAGLGALGALPAGYQQLTEQGAIAAGFTPEQARFMGRLAAIVSPGLGGLEQGVGRAGQVATAGLGAIGAAKGALETEGGPGERLAGAAERGLDWAQYGQPVGALAEATGVARRAGEAWTDYAARAQRLGATPGGAFGADAGRAVDEGQDVLRARAAERASAPLSPRGNVRDAAGEAIQARAARERHLAALEAQAAGVTPEAATAAPAAGAVGDTARVQPGAAQAAQEALPGSRRLLLPSERDALRRAAASGREPPPEAAAALRRVTGAGGDEADEVVGELLHALPPRPADPAGASNWDRLLAFMTSNLLSNPRSLLGNAFGGVEQLGGRAVTRLSEGGVRQGPQELWTELKAMWAARGDTLRAGGRAFLTGERPAAVAEALQEATDQTPQVFGGKRGLAAVPALRVAGGTDALFAMSARAGAEAVADTRGLVGPARDAFIKAQVEQSVLSAAPSSLAKMVSEGRRLLASPDPRDKLKGAAVFAYIPVVRIPETIWKQGVRRAISPVVDLPGAAKDVVNLARGRPQDAGPALRNWTTNSTVAGLAAWQVGEGNLTGSGPQNPEERKRWEAQGWRPNSFRVGDDWYSYEWLGPLALQLNLVASFAEAWRGRGQPPPANELERFGRAFNRAAAVTVDEHFLRNFFRVVESIGDGRATDALAQGALELGGRLVPVAGALNWAAGGLDPLERQAQTPLERQAARTPARGLLEPVIDPTTGAPLQRGGTALERLGGFGRILPQATDLRAELARLGVTAREFKPQDAVYGNVQTPEARRVLQETYGRLAGQYLRDAMARPDYRTATDAVRAATLERQLGLAERVADLEVGDRVARDPQARFELEWARTPQYRGVEGTPDRIARQNLEIREAKQQLSAYQRRYGETPGRYRFYEEHPDLIDFARRPEVPARSLAEEKARLRRRFGLPAPGEEADAALFGAGDRVLDAASAPFVAPGAPPQRQQQRAQEAFDIQRELEGLIARTRARSSAPTGGGGGFRFIAP